jgi:hypothetical protein
MPAGGFKAFSQMFKNERFLTVSQNFYCRLPAFRKRFGGV